MKAFEYVNATTLRAATQALGRDAGKAKILAGGIDLLSELKERIIEPDRVVNIKQIPGLNAIKMDNRGLGLGALVTLAEIESHPAVKRNYTALAQAAHSVASQQIRNVGTIGGNLCQRPRCWYYRDEEIKCLKKGGNRCYAADDDGDNKFNAILGGGPSYIVHPSDCATALVALGARVKYMDGTGKMVTVPAEEFFILPSDNARRENILKPGEIVTEIIVPRPGGNGRSVYIKFREKDSFDWAASAVAIKANVGSGGVIQQVTVVLGGVAPKPWRSLAAEKILEGKKLTPQLANQAAEAALADARPLSRNAYKIPLTKVLIRRALNQVAGVKEA